MEGCGRGKGERGDFLATLRVTFQHSQRAYTWANDGYRGASLSLVRAGLGMVGLDRSFGAPIHTVEMVARGKPASDLFLQAATQTGVQPPD